MKNVKLKFYKGRTLLDGKKIQNIKSLNLDISCEGIAAFGNVILTLELYVDFDGSALPEEELRTIGNNTEPSEKSESFSERADKWFR